MATPAASEVQALFNGKARSWPSKYAPGGKLNPRLEQFVARLSQLCLPPGRILDLGCGTGEMAAAICRMGYRVTACDISENMLETARNHWMGMPVGWLSLEPGWTVLPFENRRFDGIVASSVFEYLMDVEGVVGELARVLRPEGVLIFSVPNPCNRIRKAEAWLGSGFLPRTVLPSFCRIRAVRSYLAYLRLSRNRLGAGRWKSILAAAGFEAVSEMDFSEESWLKQANSALVLVAVKKTARGQSQPF